MKDQGSIRDTLSFRGLLSGSLLRVHWHRPSEADDPKRHHAFPPTIAFGMLAPWLIQ
jgi:hypothetical protein